MDGYIRVYRKILENCIFDDPLLLKIWIWCLCKASYKEKDFIMGNQTIHILPSQFVFGRSKTAATLHIADSMLYRKIKLLEKMAMLELKSNNKFTVVTIVNWGIYQEIAVASEQQTDSKRTTDEQQTDSKRTASEQQMNTNNKENKDKKEKKENKENKKDIETAKHFFESENLNSTFLEFISMRKKIKAPMTDRAIDLAVAKLKKLATLPFSDDLNEEMAIEILNNSIMNSWKGLFALKEDRQKCEANRIANRVSEVDNW